MKSRAELLRTIKQPGLVIQVVEHWQPHLTGTSRIPKSIRNGGQRGIQTNGYWFDGLSYKGEPCEMWAQIPPASDLRFNEDGTVTFYPSTKKAWTLRFVA